MLPYPPRHVVGVSNVGALGSAATLKQIDNVLVLVGHESVVLRINAGFNFNGAVRVGFAHLRVSARTTLLLHVAPPLFARGKRLDSNVDASSLSVSLLSRHIDGRMALQKVWQTERGRYIRF